MDVKSIYHELRRRNVFKVAGVYIIAGWVIVQVAATTFPFLNIPDWGVRLIIALVLLGFPIALILAWAFELTPGGMKRTEEVHPEHSITKATGRKLNNIFLIVLALAVVVLSYKVFLGRQTAPVNPSQTKPATVDTLSIPSHSIAVLPFENMSADSGNAYFSSGIRDLILTRLDEIGGLKVIARTTSDQYKSRPEDLRTVGRQLGVATVLEGSVQKVANQVLINVQLINTKTSGHLWARDYTRTLNNIFGVEGEVADSIARSLHTTLTPEEAKVVHQIATRNPQAYDLYLKANYIYRSYFTTGASLSDFNEAIDFSQKAIDLDSTYTLAYAEKAELLAWENLLHGYDKGRYETAYNAAQKALKLNPELPEAYMAMGGVYLLGGKMEYEQALQYLNRAYAQMPNNPDLLERISDAHKRLGQWGNAKTELKRVTELDPRNNIYLRRLGQLYACLRLYAKAGNAYKQGLTVNPDDDFLKIVYYAPTLMMEGKTDSARRMLLRMTHRLKEHELSSIWHNYVYAILGHIYANERNFEKARLALSSIKTDPETAVGLYGFGLTIVDPTVSMIRLYMEQGDREQARDEARLAKDTLSHYWAQYANHHDFEGAGYYVGLAWVKAGLGDTRGAIRAAQTAVRRMPITRDALWGPRYVEALAEIYTQTGYTDQAIATLKQLLEMQGGGMAISPAELRQDPVWDPLRKDPRFQALVRTGQTSEVHS